MYVFSLLQLFPNAGVWVGDNKVAAVGISSSRWITTDGFALNVNPDLSYFDTSVIIPCGIEGKGVTSIAKVLSERRGEDHQAVPTLQEVATVVVKTMENVFGVRLEHAEPLQ
jgi:lipoate-protein ligase B